MAADELVARQHISREAPAFPAGHLADVIPINRALPANPEAQGDQDLPSRLHWDIPSAGSARPFPVDLVLCALRAVALGLFVVGVLCVMAGALVVVSMDRR